MSHQMWKCGKELPFPTDMDLKGPAEERESANLWGAQGHPSVLRLLCVTRHTPHVVGHTLEIGEATANSITPFGESRNAYRKETCGCSDHARVTMNIHYLTAESQC